jgi:hypothetical protein
LAARFALVCAEEELFSSGLYHFETALRFVGEPREIVSPRTVQVVIQEDGRKQAKLQRGAGFKLRDDLPRAEVLLVGVGANEIEVELVSAGFGQEVAAAGERFQIEELVFD